MAGKGIKVWLLAPETWRPVDGLFVGQTLELRQAFRSFEVYTANVWRSGHIASYLFPLRAVIKAIMAFQPDIVQIEQEVYSLTTVEVLLISKLLRKRVVVFGWENLDRSLHISQRVARKVNLRLADAIICGNNDGAELVREWGYRGLVEIMPQLGIDPSVFFPRPRRARTVLVIGFVGRLVTEKGGDVLLHAFKLLADKGLPAELIIAGSGPQCAEWKALAAELGVSPRVTWLDPVPTDRVPEIMAQLDLLILPSRTMPWWKEQFGLVLVQAMAMGIPVVGAQSGAIPEVIGRADVLFPEDDVAALAAVLENLVGSADWRNELVGYGIERVRLAFTNERIAERLLELYRNMQGYSH
jgi:glycosyltransferase involved in cell wall biosynthesis